MRVIRAEVMGMYFGVRYALKVIEGISDPQGVAVLGQLVHNEVVLDDLKARGFAMQHEPTGDRSGELVSGSGRVPVTASGSAIGSGCCRNRPEGRRSTPPAPWWCGPTRLPGRFRPGAIMCWSVDAAVVVGGRNSNNTRELVDLCWRRGLPVVHVQSPSDLDPAWFKGFAAVGLTADASTLERTINEVHRALVWIGSYDSGTLPGHLESQPGTPARTAIAEGVAS